MGVSMMLVAMVSSVNGAEPAAEKIVEVMPEAMVASPVSATEVTETVTAVAEVEAAAVDIEAKPAVVASKAESMAVVKGEPVAVVVEARPVDKMAMIDAQIRSSFAATLPSLSIDSIADTPIEGLYEVVFGTRVVYVSGDGRYILQGQMDDLETGDQITDQRKSVLRKAVVKDLKESDMIIYGNKDAKHTITVFTDLDCGYCRKLHGQMDQYIEQDIRIRYLAWPRAGIPSQAATDITSVWCADDPKKAMDIAKSGGLVEPRDCDNPVASQFSLGQSLGINGTPALLLESGEIIPGYVPPARLRAELDKRALVN